MDRTRYFTLALCFLLIQCALSCPPSDNYLLTKREPNGTLGKRAYPIKVGNDDSVLWQNGVIIYCFADNMDATIKKNFQSLIPKAWGKWLAQGVSSKLGIEEGMSDYCTDSLNVFLQINYNDQQILTTTLGVTKLLNLVANWDYADGFSIGTVVSNIAHELGHSWGMIHEHQRLLLWMSDYGGNTRSDMFQFICLNLKDFNDRAELGLDMNKLCISQADARTAKFSAMNILPDISGDDTGVPGVVDWDSIMIYGSTAGGATVNGQL